jgi:hypothetical protein
MTRLQLELEDSRIEALEVLMKETGLSTKKDLINQALTLFEWAVRERRAGRIIAAVDEVSEKYREILMPALEQAKTFAASAAGDGR